MTDLHTASRLFAAALELRPEDRSSFLDEACGGDRSLQAEVTALLEHHGRATDFLETPPIVAAPELLADFTLPRKLGRYALLERLGAGGMGVVYLAEQDQPRRLVALKILRAGVADEAMLRRFEHEAELLGRLRHPGIAQIHEAFTAETAAGTLPYFAMEVVDGKPLTEHARERRLDLRARIELAVEVCDAIQHAHQRGIVHRDLKPANVLVDEAGRPKVLDFGVARLVDADMRATQATRPGEILGTLAYMSPEQAGGAADELDTRSDVYALGVLLYELLAERLPLRLDGLGLEEALRVIREVDPPRLGSLRRELRGDVETIVAKALAKDRDARYGSASELAEDLRRFLRDEPIVARTPSALYQLKKFTRRHTVFVASAGIIVVLVAASAIVNGRLALALAAERNEALAATRAAREQERAAMEASRRAASEAAVSRAVSGFLEDVLASAEPYVAPEDTTVAEALEWAAMRVDERFAGQPAVAAALRSRLCSIHYSRGELDAALADANAALALRRDIDDVDQPTLASSLTQLASVLLERGETLEATGLLREAIGILEQYVPEDDPWMLTALTDLGAALYAQDELEEAEPVMRRALELRRRVYGSEHPYTLTALNNLANLTRKQGDLAAAEPMIRENMDVSRRVLSVSHPNTITAIYNYADLLRELGRFDEAKGYFEEAISLGTEHLPTGHWLVGLYRSRYGELLLETGELDAAREHLTNGYLLLAQTLGPDHERTRRAASALEALANREPARSSSIGEAETSGTGE